MTPKQQSENTEGKEKGEENTKEDKEKGKKKKEEEHFSAYWKPE